MVIRVVKQNGMGIDLMHTDFKANSDNLAFSGVRYRHVGETDVRPLTTATSRRKVSSWS